MIVGLPSGIGDQSWAISKLVNAPEWNEIEIEVADGWPFRSDDYLAMLGKKCVYGQFRYEDIVVFEQLHPYKTWQDISNKGFGKFLMQPNHHLERGLPLKDYLPDLKTDYHYNLNIPSIENKSYYPLLKTGNWVGISAASYRGHKAWKTWDLENWTELCKMLIASEYNICLLGGSWDDLTRSLEYDLPSNVCLNLVGQTKFDEACAVHKLLKFYVGFSSGLGIIRTVMSLPTIMLWPEHQTALSESWADPEDLESRRYIASSYMTPRGVYNLFKLQKSLFGGN